MTHRFVGYLGHVKQVVTSPALSGLLDSRPTCLAIAASLGVHGALVAAGLPSWQCPVRSGLGIPCPGCGLSRAVVALTQGDWHQAMMIHAFAPIAAIAILIITLCGVLPTMPRKGLISTVQVLEERVGITFVALAALLGYWLIRLLFFNNILYELVM